MNCCDILMYHMVSEPQTENDRRFAITPQRLESHIRGLKHRGYSFVALDRIADWLEGKADLPDRAISVTLDDGYEDNYMNAFPIFAEHETPATVFLVSGLMGASNRWMEGRGFSRRKLMTWEQARELNCHGITLGAHTVNHVRLTEVDDQTAHRELRDSRQQIADNLGCPVAHFAYPYGLLDDHTCTLVRSAGFRTACTTRPGPNRVSTDPHLLRRVEVYGTDSLRQVARKLRYGTNDSTIQVPLKYYWSRLRARTGI